MPLEQPTSRVHASYLAAVKEFDLEGRTTGRPGIETADGFAEFVAWLLGQASEDGPLIPGYVPHTVLWLTEGQEFLGRVSIRHRLTESLLEVGGHIGYEVRPSARRLGHATRMLAAALPVARQLGIERALVTCDTTNLASRRVIEVNGGVFENEKNGKLRFWIPTTSDRSAPSAGVG